MTSYRLNRLIDNFANDGRVEFTVDATETTDACSWFINVDVQAR